METVKILRELWRRRIAVSALAALAILLGLVLMYQFALPPQSRQYQVGVASTRILVDTPKSQFVEVAPLGAETLGQRANVLAALMAEGDLKAAIAQRAGLTPADLLAVSESAEESQTVSPTDLRASDIHLLRTRVVRDSNGGQLPIIEVETQAPDSAGATRLVNAAVTGVSEYLDSKAAGEQIADRRRLKVSSLGINPGRLVVRGPGLLIGAGAGILAFLLGCAAILAVSALSRNWREAEAQELDARDDVDGAGPEPAAPTRRAELERVADPKPEAIGPHGLAAAWHHPEMVVRPFDRSKAPPPRGREAQARPAGPPEGPLKRGSLSARLGGRSANAETRATEVESGPPVRDPRSPDAASGQ